MKKTRNLYKKILKKDRWADIYNHGHIQLAYSQFSIKMKTHFDIHFPIHHIKIKYSNINEWINSTLKKDNDYLFIRRNIQPKKTKINIQSLETKIF